MTALVIGLGTDGRGDDAVGPLLACALGAALTGVDVVEHEDPTDLVLAWAEHPWAIVADAVVSGAPAGTVLVAELADGGATCPDAARLGLGGTHAFGLAEAVELARAIGRLPERVTLVGVEAADVTPGAGVSAAVRAAVPEAVERVRRLVAAAEGAPDVSR